MTMAEIVCLILRGTNRRSKRSLKGWVSSERLKRITSQGAVQSFTRNMEQLYVRLDNSGNHSGSLR